MTGTYVFYFEDSKIVYYSYEHPGGTAFYERGALFIALNEINQQLLKYLI